MAQPQAVSNTLSEILTIDDVAKLLKLRPEQIYSLTRRRGQRRHGLPVVHIGGHLRFLRSQIETWIAEQVKH